MSLPYYLKREWDALVQHQIQKTSHSPEAEAILKVNSLLEQSLLNDPPPIKLIYVAAPYYHQNPAITKDRAHLANKYAAFLLTKGFNVLSPLTLNDSLNPYMNPEYKWNSEFWMPKCLQLLSLADEMHALTLNDWKSSKGLQTEITYAEKYSIPITYVSQNEI